MKLRFQHLLFAALIGVSQPALAQDAPWVGNSSVGEGAGVRTGNVEWHPGISGEFGYDSNYLQRANSTTDATNFGPVVPALRLRVTPQISLRMADGTEGSSEGAEAPPKRPISFNASGSVSYNEIIALDSDYKNDFSQLRNLAGGGSLGVIILPSRPWSGHADAGYSYTAEPSNQGGLGAQFNRHLINVGGGVRWAPGGGSFEWNVIDYGTSVTFFDNAGFAVNDNGNHQLGSNGSWKFLPKTALLYDASLAIIRYDTTNLNDGETLQGRMGLRGLLTKKISLMGLAGWATSFYRNNNGVARNYNDFIAQAEAKWYFSPHGRLKDGDVDVGASALTLGYQRDFQDSYLGDFFRRDRGYTDFSYLINQNIITIAGGGVSRVTYPDYFTNPGVGAGFGETRVDVQGFVEYRPIPTVGVNLQLRYDVNISQIITSAAIADDLSFNRFRAMLGARWFL